MSKQRKRRLILALVIVLAAMGAIGATLAYFTDYAEQVNTFTVGDLDIDLPETWDPTDGTEMEPGETIVKRPVVVAVKGNSYMRVVVTILDKNDGVPAGTKVTDPARLTKILQTIYFDPTAPNTVQTVKPFLNGTNILTANKYTLAQMNTLVTAGTVKNPFNTGAGAAQFTLDAVRSVANSGVYYLNYNSIFKAAAGVTPADRVVVFTNVVIPSDWKQTDLQVLGKYDIVIKAEAIQTGGFVDSAAAFTALDLEVAP